MQLRFVFVLSALKERQLSLRKKFSGGTFLSQRVSALKLQLVNLSVLLHYYLSPFERILVSTFGEANYVSNIHSFLEYFFVFLCIHLELHNVLFSFQYCVDGSRVGGYIASKTCDWVNEYIDEQAGELDTEVASWLESEGLKGGNAFSVEDLLLES